MKKPVLAALGLGAACAACCAAPVALSMMAGLGVAGFGLAGLGTAAFGWVAGGTAAVTMLMALAGLYLWRRRRQAQACASDRSCGCG